MKILTRILAVGLWAAFAASLLAADVTGVWKGKVSFDRTQMPKSQNAEQQKGMEAGLAMVKNLQVVLTLKANKTYTAVAKNVPGKEGDQKSEGTWKQEGNTLWLTTVTDNGKPSKDKKPQKFLVLEGGKKLSLAAEGMPKFMKVTFTR